jgi:peptidoglycan/LPS O-acetylase OafA/YrhL
VVSSARDRLGVLDGLRGFAILLVVWYHAWLVSGQGIAAVNFLAEAGFLGVDLFFFISGFCVFYPYARARADGRPDPPVRRFFERRTLKILPSYLLALVVFAIVYHDRFASPQDALVQLGSHVAFVHTLNPATYGSISGPLWTIGVEVQFYLLFPLIAPWFRRSPIAGYVALVAIAEGYRLMLGALGLSNQFGWINQLPAVLDLFGAGMLAAYAFVTLRDRAATWQPHRVTGVSIVATALGFAGIAAAAWAADTQTVDGAHVWLNAYRFAIGPLLLVLTLSTCFATKRWQAFVTPRVLTFLSLISYNLYLWNLEVAVWIHGTGLSAPATFALSIVAAVGLAAFITYAFERPILTGSLPSLRVPARAVFAWLGTYIAGAEFTAGGERFVDRGVRMRSGPFSHASATVARPGDR